jgi:hypothetical protein
MSRASPGGSPAVLCFVVAVVAAACAGKVRVASSSGSGAGGSSTTTTTASTGAGSMDAGPDGDACVPLTCTDQGFDCGTASDGCGGQIDCGTCPSGSFCGCMLGPPPWKLNKCFTVAMCCDCCPKTCAQLNYECGPASDGCGDVLECGTCAPPETCGGGGEPNVCGTPDGGVDGG